MRKSFIMFLAFVSCIIIASCIENMEKTAGELKQMTQVHTSATELAKNVGKLSSYKKEAVNEE